LACVKKKKEKHMPCKKLFFFSRGLHKHIWRCTSNILKNILTFLKYILNKEAYAPKKKKNHISICFSSSKNHVSRSWG
jgi:hypothetical protein